MPSPVQVSKSGPGLVQVMKDLDRVRRSEVLVGIPAEKTPRKDSGQSIRIGGVVISNAKQAPVNNAELLFIHTHGSPLRNIPARPVLEPAIEKNRDLITTHLGEAAKALMDGRPQPAEQSLKRAGVVASNAAKRYFVEGNLAPNAPSTIKRKGSDRPLVDTSQMRRSITSIVRVNP